MVFESERLSVLVADPRHTKVNIRPESPGGSNGMDYLKNPAICKIMGEVSVK